MKLRFLLLIILMAVVARPVLPQQPEKPLTKSQIMELVKAEMDNAKLAQLVRERGIDFEPTDDDVQALRKAGAQDVLIAALHAVKPQPLTRDQVLHLVAGGVPIERAATLVKQRGIDFLADEEYLNTLRVAGADDALITVLREASAAVTAELTVTTSPNAEVYLDGKLQGHADAQGELTLKSKPGAHQIKVLLAGKKDFEQNLALAARQTTRIEARLGDVPGSIRLRTLAGASISLDGASRGSTDASGELVLPNVPPGAHELRVSAPEKREYLQSVTVTPGQETRVEATLQSAPPSPGQARENPKDGLKYVWIPPGTFQMGCSPGDSECFDNEKPSHPVRITKGFWIGQTEVTVGAYKRFASQTGRRMPHPLGYDSKYKGWANDAMPMGEVQLNDARSYCQWAGGRVPTEAEWEYAARGGSPEARYGVLDEVAWYSKSTWKNTTAATGVAQKRANGFGLFDMLGNVEEWVSDWYGPYYYQNSPATDPQGPAGGKDRVLRGGSAYVDSRAARVSYRNRCPQLIYDDATGCRCVWEANHP
ncbi:MAG: SUMF1/EgtB/PvdO family nonheme iron enzyme [Terriglobia bacterium]